MSQLHDKLKQFNIQYYQLANPTIDQWQQFGPILDKRFKLLDSLLSRVKRGLLSEQQLLNHLGAFIIVRAVEDDLSLYQDEITQLSEQLEVGNIDESEFTDRLTAMTAAILMIMFLLGSNTGNSEQLTDLRLSLESGEFPDINLSSLPTEVNAQLQQAFNIAQTSALNLGNELIEGNFEPGGNNLADRLAMWLNTAIGVYGLGQLFNSEDNYLRWVKSPRADSCPDCIRLNGQVHRASEWRASGWQPKGHNLSCQGFRCGCTFVEVSGPSKGNF